MYALHVNFLCPIIKPHKHHDFGKGNFPEIIKKQKKKKLYKNSSNYLGKTNQIEGW